ncbi:uncharacterized transmembrane protein DDB_G0289901-like isoform X2 [Aplysia californica]|uniref:Uncharacterized transmembrane protein DDB_G0289901-like isoform X2 n=1 Tax=Aplysia californica TaxID=6500 RepID=A0ABM1ADA4_APLCA|nr:uncharacterized transmembrane protein DDB_G0289901-like isoform X2 [Aplysia californica]
MHPASSHQPAASASGGGASAVPGGVATSGVTPLGMSEVISALSGGAASGVARTLGSAGLGATSGVGAGADITLPNESKINKLIRKMAVDMLTNRIALSKVGSGPPGFNPILADELVKLLGSPSSTGAAAGGAAGGGAGGLAGGLADGHVIAADVGAGVASAVGGGFGGADVAGGHVVAAADVGAVPADGAAHTVGHTHAGVVHSSTYTTHKPVTSGPVPGHHAMPTTLTSQHHHHSSHSPHGGHTPTTIQHQQTSPWVHIFTPSPNPAPASPGAGTMAVTSVGNMTAFTDPSAALANGTASVTGNRATISDVNIQLASLAQDVIKALLSHSSTSALASDRPLVTAAQTLLSEIRDITNRTALSGVPQVGTSSAPSGATAQATPTVGVAYVTGTPIISGGMVISKAATKATGGAATLQGALNSSTPLSGLVINSSLDVNATFFTDANASFIPLSSFNGTMAGADWLNGANNVTGGGASNVSNIFVGVAMVNTTAGAAPPTTTVLPPTTPAATTPGPEPGEPTPPGLPPPFVPLPGQELTEAQAEFNEQRESMIG